MTRFQAPLFREENSRMLELGLEPTIRQLRARRTSGSERLDSRIAQLLARGSGGLPDSNDPEEVAA